MRFEFETLVENVNDEVVDHIREHLEKLGPRLQGDDLFARVVLRDDNGPNKGGIDKIVTIHLDRFFSEAVKPSFREAADEALDRIEAQIEKTT